jgi:hypothetical protein
MEQGAEHADNKTLAQRQGNELRQNFEQIKRLFDFAAGRLDPDTSYDEYVGRMPGNRQRPPKLPDELKNTAAEYPGEYSVVYYTNRNSSYYAEGTRGRTVGLSTSERRSQSNQRVREIDFREPGADERDPRMYMTVTEMVNEKSFESINTAGEDEIERPHGQAFVTFGLTPAGQKEIVRSYFSRLDEGMFDWRGSQEPVRWNRMLLVQNDSKGTLWKYDDQYIIGRIQENKTDERAQVRTVVRGSLENPESIGVEIGIGGGVSGRMLYQDDRLQVYVNDAIGSYRSEAEILKQDPNYGFLFEGAIDPARVISMVQSRIRLLQEDWDKPHPVFGASVEAATSGRLSYSE